MTRGRHPTFNRLLFYLLCGLLALLTGACNRLGFVTSGAPTSELESTVVAMKATLQTLEDQSDEPVAQSSPQIVVVTATPTETLLPTPTPLPTITPTSTPVPTDTSTPAPAAQGRTIVIVVTPTLPPTATPYPDAPVNTGPRDGTVVGQGQETLLHWSWNGLLGPNEYFEVKLRPDAQSRSVYIAQELGEGHELRTMNLAPGRYQWTVQVVRGYFINDSGHPDDWVFEAFRSPESEPSLIIIDADDDNDDDDDDDDSPASQSQAEPVHPDMPVGLTLGGLAFAILAIVTRFTDGKQPEEL